MLRRELPEPTGPRWQPLRVGLVDLFYYDTEEFWFRDGRLLLRGNNGTGKSKVLALALPFLLDGDHRPQRVEPDGDPQKRMEWNLLLGGRYHDRLGYTWLEFGRRDDDGTAVTLTVGCGLKAAAGRGIAQKWFFLTSQRVGLDLHLVDANNLALSRERLRDALGDRGQIIDGVEAYRRAVDERLFGLGERYPSLVTLLIQLRQPQLSKRPNEEALSRALTEALPPLEQDVVADVAAALRTLEDDRAQLDELVAARRAVAGFAGRYRRYAAIATRRRGADVLAANSAYEKTGRALGQAAAAQTSATADETRLRGDDRGLRRRLDELRAAERALRQSPQLRDAARLRSAAEAAERAAHAARHAAGDVEEAEVALRDRRREAHEADAAFEDARTERERLARAAAEAASDAGIATEHERLTTPVLVGGADAAPAAAAESGTDVLAARRLDAVRHVRRLARAVDDAQRDRNAARHAADDAERDRDAVAETLAAIEVDRRQRAAALVTAVETHLAGTVELRVPEAGTVVAALEAWTVEADGPNPVVAAVERAARAAAVQLAAEDSRLAQQVTTVVDELAGLEAERERLAAGEHPAPPVPHTRGDAGREGRRGAPLWQLVEFVDGLSADRRAGIEAALEAAGLLDAWVTPDGGLLAAGTLDVAVTAAPAVGRSLAEVVRAVDGGPVAADVVDRILCGIGYGPAGGDSWVDDGGHYRVGVTEGAWAKPAATYLGFSAREAARRDRLAELVEAITDADARRERLRAARERIAARHQTLDGEVATVPPDGPLLSAAAAADSARRGLAHAEQRVSAALERLMAADRALRRAATARDTAAADLALPADTEGLDRVEDAVSAYRLAQARLWPGVRAAGHAAAARRRAAERLDSAGRTQARRREAAERAERDASALAVEHETLRSLVGTATAEAEARLSGVLAEIATAEAAREELSARLQDARERVVRAEERQRLLDEQHTAQREARTGAVDAFRRFAAAGFAAAAGADVALPDPGQPWAPDPTVRLVRRLDQELAGVDDSDAAWERSSATITGALADLQAVLASQGASAEGELREDAFVVTVRYRSLVEPPHRLVAVLEDEVAQREELLDAREREILENHLVSDVASHLSQLIADADARVTAMNAELQNRPTSTGMVLRLRWDVDEEQGPTGIRQARRRLLRQRSEMWSPEDREALGSFLKAEIDRLRAEDESGTWFDHLARAFDYRRWHRFSILRKQADGSWRKATGPASGGERVLAVTLPLFAAASSHYSTAAPAAPRLVLLDEAFAGVDDTARRQCMGLLSTFDLDYVMTSEREWGCYPEVPGLSICHLVRREGVEAVHVSRWEWDGRVRAQVTHAGDSARQRAPVVEASPEGLFGER